jgi:hypothetical protein
MTSNLWPLLIVPIVLTACSHDPGGVRISHDSPSAPAPAARTEPVFYNGKTYQVAINPNPDGSISMNIGGMNVGQGRDATALASSTLHHFACKDSQKAVLQGQPAFDGAHWNANGSCV